MKHKPKHGPPDFPGRDRKGFPKPLCDALNEKGLSTEGLIFSCTGDMDGERCFRNSWLFFDKNGLYIATGTEKIVKSKRKHIEPEFKVEEIQAIPAEDIDSLETERYSSTGRLIMSSNGEQKGLTYFSIGLIGEFDKFVRAFNTMKETGEAVIPEDDGHEERKCKKCGAPCPPGKDFCRKHSRTGATAVRLIKFFGGYVPQISAIVLIMAASSAISVFIPQVSTRALYDDVLSNPDGNPVSQVIKALGTLVLTIVGIRALNAFFTIVQQYMSATIMPKVMYDIKLKIFEAMQRLSINFYSSKQTGSLMDRVMRDANNIYWFFTDGIPRVIIDTAMVIGILIVMFKMSPGLSLIALGLTPLLIFSFIMGDKLFRSMVHRVWIYRAKLGSMVSDNINGQRVIKAFAKERDEFDRFSSTSDDVMKAEVKLGVTEATVFPIIEVLVALITVVILAVGSTMVVRNENGLTAGSLLSFIVYIEMLKEPFSFLPMVSNWWSRCADSAQRIFEICDSKPEITEKEDAVSLENMNGDLKINELEFEYEPARPVIQKLSLEVKGGTMLGIVGKTGAGKTTIANLIARLYDAKGGSVAIDGVDVRDLRLNDLRKNVGMVSQDIYLFIGSIADNIRYAKPDADMGEVIAAAKAACAHEFIMKLPDGYETRVGAGGQKLSGGERQRISIARTIIQNPKILILDEATAAMDTETERNIQHSLSQLIKGRTTIAIAHRLSTLRDADNLAVIDEGKVVEYGTYSKLMKLKGEFYRQYKIQSEALKAIGIGEGDAVPEETGEEDEHERTE